MKNVSRCFYLYALPVISVSSPSCPGHPESRRSSSAGSEQLEGREPSRCSLSGSRAASSRQAVTAGLNQLHKLLLTIQGGDVVSQVGPHRGPRPLHEQLAVGAPMARHQVVILGRTRPGGGRRGEPEQASIFQMLMSHCGGGRVGRGGGGVRTAVRTSCV